MTIFLQVILAFILTLLSSCNSKSNNTNDINRTPAMVDTPRSYVKNYGANDNNQLFVFVGEKIFVDLLPHKDGSMDNGFKAKYAILKKVYGNFPSDSIEFVAYDHYGTPAFSKYKNVLLYVSADSGTYYHQKYLYNDVYKTQNGRWAGLYASDDYEHGYNKHTKVKPEKIEFAEKVSFPTKIVDEEGKQIELSYPNRISKQLATPHLLFMVITSKIYLL